LVVDDEVYNCDILKTIISSLGIKDVQDKLTICKSGAEALEAFKRGCSRGASTYSVIFTDLSMPGIDGYKLMSKVRKHLQHLEIT